MYLQYWLHAYDANTAPRFYALLEIIQGLMGYMYTYTSKNFALYISHVILPCTIIHVPRIFTVICEVSQ